MSVTIKDIAKIAGVGTSTVSAYLNGVTIRPQNRAAVEAAIKTLGYIRNDYARGLKTRKSKTIGVIIPELSNTFGTTIIGSLEKTLSAQGYGILVCDHRATGKTEAETADFLLSKMVDALVVVMPDSADGGFLDTAVAGGIPVVVVDRIVRRNDVVQIVINNAEVSYAAVKKMIDCGHKSIGIITGEQSIYTASERHRGYMNALSEIGCYKEEYVYDGRLSVDGAYVAMKRLLTEHPEITALFVTNYEMTIGAIIAANEVSKKIGTDISFVGFDNLCLSQVVTPVLATVEQPMEDMGRIAAEIILKAIDSGVAVPQTITLCAKFEKGHSIKEL